MAAINRKLKDYEEYKDLFETEDKRPADIDRIKEIAANRANNLIPEQPEYRKGIKSALDYMKVDGYLLTPDGKPLVNAEQKHNLVVSNFNKFLDENEDEKQRLLGLVNGVSKNREENNSVSTSLPKDSNNDLYNGTSMGFDISGNLVEEVDNGEKPNLPSLPSNEEKGNQPQDKENKEKAESENVDADGEGTLPYQPSDMVSQYQAKLDELIANAPSKFDGGTFQQKVQEAMDKILNREQFSYDMNADAMYQQYKDNYINQGKLAMQNAIGQASAMTGGYGNSYAAQVGNQAYQQNLQRLNDVVPELYQLAQNRYNMEGQNLLQNYQMAQDQYNQAYNEYRDNVSDYNRNLQNAYNMLVDERNYNRAINNDAFNQLVTLDNMNYNRLNDAEKLASENAFKMPSETDIEKWAKWYGISLNDDALMNIINQYTAGIDNEVERNKMASDIYNKVLDYYELGKAPEETPETDKITSIYNELKSKVDSGTASKDEIKALKDGDKFAEYLRKNYGTELYSLYLNSGYGKKLWE